MNDFADILPESYAEAFATPWKEGYTLRHVTTDAVGFELCDRKSEFLQAAGEGVVKYANASRTPITVIDFEHFIDQFTQSVRAGRGKKCDFILYTSDKTGTFIFNEVSQLNSQSLTSFREKNDKYSGKRDKAVDQLSNSIERVCTSPALAACISRYRQKVALFAIRLTDISAQSMHADPMLRSMAAFRSPLQMQANIDLPAEMPHGFTFRRCIYPEAFAIS